MDIMRELKNRSTKSATMFGILLGIILLVLLLGNIFPVGHVLASFIFLFIFILVIGSERKGHP